VPVLPGSQGVLSTTEEAARTAEQIGYPVILKASAGADVGCALLRENLPSPGGSSKRSRKLARPSDARTLIWRNALEPFGTETYAGRTGHPVFAGSGPRVFGRLALQALCRLLERSGARGQAFGVSPEQRPVLPQILRFRQFLFVAVKDGQQLDLLFEKVPILVTSLDELRICLRKPGDQQMEVLDVSPGGGDHVPDGLSVGLIRLQEEGDLFAPLLDLAGVGPNVGKVRIREDRHGQNSQA